jgi:succinate dehydrogenase / fumarate reductase membrane anchor subunit
MGVKQWVFQRLSNLIIIIFGAWLLAFLAGSGEINQQTLTALLSDGTTKLFLLITLVFACLNAMLAGWQIAGDYARKVNLPESLLTGIGVVVSALYLFCGLALLF